MKPIIDEAKLLVPVRTGALRDSITSEPQFKLRPTAMGRRIGFRRPVSRRAHFVEFGTSKMAAEPFMRPAIDARAEDAVEAMIKVLAAAVRSVKPVKIRVRSLNLLEGEALERRRTYYKNVFRKKR